MTYNIIKIIHILSVIGLLGPLVLTPKWIYLYYDRAGQKILKDLHKLTGISGWIVFLTGFILLGIPNFSLLEFFWIKVSIFIFLFIQIFDHFWADKIEEQLENEIISQASKLKIWLIFKIILYILITILMVLK